MTTNKEGLKSARAVIEKLTGPYSFAMFMRSMRTTLDLSQTEMAKKLGISRQALCEIESGRALVSVASAVKYAKLGGLSKVVAVEACLQDQIRKAQMDYRVRLEKIAR